MSKSRQMTEKEVREKLLKQLRIDARYWANLEGRTCLEKVEGAIFSTLVALDGEAGDLPAFIVAPNPHPDDRDFLKNEGKNWYPENHKSKIACNIGGSLHDNFYKVK